MNPYEKQKVDITRRRFLQAVSAGTAATLVAGPGYLSALTPDDPASRGKQKRYVQINRSRIPVLRKADVILVGGSVAGVAAALCFARAGFKVVLVEHRNYLGREVSATLRPWIDLDKLGAAGQAPEPIASCLKKMRVEPRAGEIALGMDAFKLSLEQLLLDAGVQFVYSSLPTETIVAEGVLRGVVIGNKSGRQALLGRMVVEYNQYGACGSGSRARLSSRKRRRTSVSAGPSNLKRCRHRED